MSESDCVIRAPMVCPKCGETMMFIDAFTADHQEVEIQSECPTCHYTTTYFVKPQV